LHGMVISQPRARRLVGKKALQDARDHTQRYSAASRRPEGASGKVQITVVPRFSPVSTRTVPPCSSTKLLTMERPRPAPRLRPPLTRDSKRLTTGSTTFGGVA